MSKLAVFFPGIGYTMDRPLLHFSRRLAESLGYDCKPLPYGGFPSQVRGDRRKMEACFHLARSQAEEMLSGTAFSDFDDVVFIGKSVGTIVAAAIAASSAVPVRLVLYTPLEDTFSFPLGQAVAFTGGADPWVGGAESRIAHLCAERGIPCLVIPGANHSLETDRVRQDIRTLDLVMEQTERFLRGGGAN